MPTAHGISVLILARGPGRAYAPALTAACEPTEHGGYRLTIVCKVQAESRRLGVANVYSIDGKLYYELPNGDYSRTPPSRPRPP